MTGICLKRCAVCSALFKAPTRTADMCEKCSYLPQTQLNNAPPMHEVTVWYDLKNRSVVLRTSPPGELELTLDQATDLRNVLTQVIARLSRD